jgi:electron transfer flavoprotein alpha subunit
MADIYVYGSNLSQVNEIASLIKSAGHSSILFCVGEHVDDEVRSSGADRIILLKNEDGLPENHASEMARILQERNAKAFLVESSVRGREIAAHVAGILNAPMLSEVSSLDLTDESFIGQHVLFGGLMLRKASVNGFGVATIQAGSCEMNLAPEQAAPVEEILCISADNRLTLIDRQAIQKSGTDLSRASSIVCVGLGIEKKEDLVLAEELARELGGAVGCTRGVAEDKGWLPAECYIGISGKVLNPDLYLGIAVSGQVQHVYGIRGAKIIAAINADESSPMVKSSDYAIIGDYREILPVLNASICR